MLVMQVFYSFPHLYSGTSAKKMVHSGANVFSVEICRDSVLIIVLVLVLL